MNNSTNSNGSELAGDSKKSSPPYGKFVVLLAFIIMIVQWGVIYSFGVYFKPMIAEFGWSRASTAAAFSLANILSGFVAVFMGWLNDRLGSRVVMSLCGIFLGLGCILISRTQSLLNFYLFYGLIVGLAMSGSFIPLISTVTRWFSANRGLMIGIVASGVGVGALVGPQVSNLLLIHRGWRESYLITGITALVLVVVAAQFLKRPWGLRVHTDTDHVSPTINLKNTNYQDASLKQALGSYQFWIFSLTGFCYGYTLFSLSVHVVPHAVDLGVTPEIAAGLLSTFGGLSVLGKIIFGKVLDKIKSRKTMIIGFSMMAVAYFLLVFADKTRVIFFCVGLFGLFYGACTVSHSPITAILFGLNSHGLILGVFAISVNLGGAFGPFFTGAIYDWTESYRMAFAICTVVSITGVVATAAIRYRRILIASPIKK